jgi:hypothetical protein
MKPVLVTFSGKHGDILWSALAAKTLAATGVEVDFAMMPQYARVAPLLAIQPYIRAAFPIEEWIQNHDQFGAQPRIPPRVPPGYDRVLHLTYEQHPQEPLALYTMRLAGLTVPEKPLPFLFADSKPEPGLVAYAFNGSHIPEKLNLLAKLRRAVSKARFENVEHLPFDQAARRINAAHFFFGCRSANYVVAVGLGKRCLSIEPDGGRQSDVFGFPGSREHRPHPAFTHQFIDLAQQWMETCD